MGHPVQGEGECSLGIDKVFFGVLMGGKKRRKRRRRKERRGTIDIDMVTGDIFFLSFFFLRVLFIRYLGGDRCKRRGCFFHRRRQFYTCNGWIGIYSICPSDISLKKRIWKRNWNTIKSLFELRYSGIFPREGELIHRSYSLSYRLVLSIREML